MTIHELKSWPDFFEPLACGVKALRDMRQALPPPPDKMT
jgi:hypothetical protein